MHMNVSKDLTPAGMAGVVSVTSSVDKEIGPYPGPGRLIVSTGEKGSDPRYLDHIISSNGKDDKDIMRQC